MDNTEDENTNGELGLRRAAEEAITVAVENGEGYFAALGRTITLLDKYDATGASRDEIVEEFNRRAKMMDKEDELMNNEDQLTDE